MSILILITVMVYTGTRSKVLILQSESNVSSVNQPVNIINDLGKVYYNQTNMLPFLKFLFLYDSIENYNISKYMNIKYQLSNLDLDNATYNIISEFNSRPC